MTELGAPTPAAPLLCLVLVLHSFWSFLPCRLAEVDRVFVLAPPRNLFSGPSTLPICLRSEVSPRRRARVSAGGGGGGFGGALAGPAGSGPCAGSSAHAPPARAPARPLLVGGGAGGSWCPGARAALPCGLGGSAGCAQPARGDVCSLHQVRLWIQGVGCEFITDVTYASWDCVFAAHGHSRFLVSEESSSGVRSDVTCRCPGGPHPAAGPVQTARSEAPRAPCWGHRCSVPLGDRGSPTPGPQIIVTEHAGFAATPVPWAPLIRQWAEGDGRAVRGSLCGQVPGWDTWGPGRVGSAGLRQPGQERSGTVPGRLCADPLLGASKATGSSSGGRVCRRPRGTNGHFAGGSCGQPRGPNTLDAGF